MTKREAIALTGGVGYPSKMPGTSFGTPASMCKTGSKLRTCAGTVCSKCYAHKGNYQYTCARTAQQRRADAMAAARTDANIGRDWAYAMAQLIEEGCAKRH